MKGFASGVGGVCVCMLAIMGTILCGFALGVEENVGTTTQYNQVADTTGLFDTSTLPAFTDYNPAANWTGYRANESDSYLGGVTYSTSAKVNGYPIPAQESAGKTITVAMPTGSEYANPPGNVLTSGVDLVIISDDKVRMTDQTTYISWPRVVTLTQALAGQDLTNISKIIVELEMSASRIWAAPSSAWTLESIRTNPSGAWANYANYMMLSYNTYNDVVRLEFTPETDIVKGMDADGNEIFRSSSDNTTLSYCQTATATGFPATTWAGIGTAPGTSMQITLYESQGQQTYMDISKGVIPIVEEGHKGEDVYWSNGYQNGRISILFMWQALAYDHTTSTDFNLTFYITQKTADGGEWTRTLSIPMLIEYWNVAEQGYGGPSLEVFIGDSSHQVSFFMGTGEGFILTVDLMNDIISAQILKTIRTFQDYDIRGEPKTTSGYIADELGLESIASGQVACDGWSLRVLKIYDLDGTFLGQELAPIMGVIDTAVYMGDTTLIMADASIKPTILWPNMKTPWELRLESFAVIGDALKVYTDKEGGQSVTMPCKDGKITVDGTEHNLQNIAIRGVWIHNEFGYWWYLYIVFHDEPGTDPVFLYSDGTASMITVEAEGYWYFTSSFYQSEEVATSTYEVDFQHYIFDSNASILCYMGLLILGTIVAKRMGGLGVYDMIVLVFAGVCGFVLMG